MIKNQMFIAAALLVGVAIGYFAKPSEAADNDAAAVREGEYVEKSAIGDKGLEASNAALKRRVAELEKMLKETSVKNAEEPVREPSEEEKNVRKHPGGGPGGRAREMREHLEWMAKEKPEEYTQLTNMMARWRQRRIERAGAKLDYLATAVDTTKLTAEQRQMHERYQDLLVRREELEDKLHNAEMTDDDREDIMRDMFETQHEMRRLAKAEREMLISQTIDQLGFSGEDAEGVKTTFAEILSVTETQGGGPNGPPPSGGGGDGGGGGMPPGGMPPGK